MKKNQQKHHRLATLEQRRDFDDIIDVRTPAEFADDHLPGAINAPVLSNEERVLIGTIYKQESVFKANRLGAALVAQNIANHLQGQFADRPREWKPLIYCWRGGKRSASMTEWFNLIGWKARQLEGGYKTWRRHVLAELAQLPTELKFIVLTGPTGSGKTRLLHSLNKAGAQTLDLEALARHRGSLLGAYPNEPQPSQRAFESELYTVIEGLDSNQPIFVEAESRRIGQRDLPASLMQSMHAGRCVKVEVTMAERIGFLLEDYASLFANPDDFKLKLSYLKQLHGKQRIADWQQLIDSDHRAELFGALVEQHYDPAYKRSSHSHYEGLGNALPFAYNPMNDHDTRQAQALLNALQLDHTAVQGATR